jgi:hypothetical protein
MSCTGVVARTAVPDAGARQSSTSPSLPGAYATILWSRPLTPSEQRIVASRAAGGARPRSGRVKASISQRAHGIGHPPRPATATPQRANRGPVHERTGGRARERCEAGSRASPTGRRGSRSGIAPTPPTRGHDPIQRLPMAVPTTMSTRNSGSRPRRSRVSGVHGCRRSHGQPRQPIMRATTAEQARPEHRTPVITKVPACITGRDDPRAGVGAPSLLDHRERPKLWVCLAMTSAAGSAARRSR